MPGEHFRRMVDSMPQRGFPTVASLQPVHDVVQLPADDNLHAPNSSDPSRNGDGGIAGDEHRAVGSKRQRSDFLGISGHDADKQPAQRAAVGRAPASLHGRRSGAPLGLQGLQASSECACIEVTFLTQERADNTTEDTSPAVSPVEEMTDRLFTIADVSNLKESCDSCAPRCAFRPRPHRARELRQEIGHMVQRVTQQREQMYADCPRYDDYLHAVQHSALDANHRRKVFEWNLGVRPDSPAKPTLSAKASLDVCII